MKIDRLIGILSILLQQEKVTAPFLAEKFEVSRRTINRDVEDLCMAGIPIVTAQGQNGGISIMEGYRMDRALLTTGDMQSILAGLRSLDSVSGTNRYQQLMEKLAAGNSSTLTSNDHIIIDLASWYKSSLTPKIELFQTAITRKTKVKFRYYAPGGESIRVMEPYFLVFQWASWYLWGYCTEKEDYRLFKLNRMLEVTDTDETFVPRKVPKPRLEHGPRDQQTIMISALFEPDMKWRLIEEYGVDSFKERGDGKLLFQFEFMDRDSVFSWILSFGERVELLEPEELRGELKKRIKKIQQNYES